MAAALPAHFKLCSETDISYSMKNSAMIFLTLDNEEYMVAEALLIKT